MTAIWMVLPILLGLLSGSSEAHAKTFMNSYVSFELSDRWGCELEMTEWICRTNEPGEAQAIIILTAKEMGPQDTLFNYSTHLHKPRMIKTRTGAPLASTVYQVEPQTINLQAWMNGFHFDSEIPNYYTRYLATTKNGIAILVTFSAHRNFYAKYSADFFGAIKSLNVVVTKTTQKNAGRDGDSAGPGTIGSRIDENFPTDSALPTEDEDGARESHRTKVFVAFGLIVAAIGILLLRLSTGQGGKRRR